MSENELADMDSRVAKARSDLRVCISEFLNVRLEADDPTIAILYATTLLHGSEPGDTSVLCAVAIEEIALLQIRQNSTCKSCGKDTNSHE